MALLNFFKKTSHQRFEYNPRYWNPQKEDLERRLELSKKKKGNDPEAIKARISAGMRRGSYMSDRSVRTNYVFKTNMIRIGILVILLLLSYLFFVNYLPSMLEALLGVQNIQVE